MKINIISIGEVKKYYYKEVLDEYLKRLGHFSVSYTAIRDNKEAYQKLEKQIAGTYTVALDEHGKQYTSRQLARVLESIELEGTTTMSLVIGPADGHPEEFLRASDFNLSLSKLTMPHEMALVFCCEAIYRALSIRNNHPYHRD